MRRRALLGIEKKQAPEPEIGTLLVDCDFDGNLNDKSGNNNHLTPSSNIQFAQVGGRDVLKPSATSFAEVTTVHQNQYINDFQIEIEFSYQNTSSPTNQNLIDASQDQNFTLFPTILFQDGSIAPATNMNYMFKYSSGSTESLNIAKSSFIVGTWYKLVYRFHNNVFFAEVTNIDNGNVLGTTTTQNVIIVGTPALVPIRIGNNRFITTRYFNGYIKNFKLWTNLI
jgi:hypothetical protein